MRRVPWRRWLARARRNAPTKVAALALAALLWLYAASDPASTAQRSLLVPLQVEGVAEDAVSLGVPDLVEFVVSGPATRVDRLRAEDLRATLDLGGASGDFSRPVETAAPGALQVVRVVPAEVIGRVEAIVRREVAVVPVAALAGADADTTPGWGSVEPPTVTVEGRTSDVTRVARVLAPARSPSGSSSAVLVPVAADGAPVEDVRVVPARASVTVQEEARRVRAELPLLVEAPQGGNLASLEPSHDVVAVQGPVEVVAGMDAVRGTVGSATRTLAPGRYTLPVLLDLPEQVAVFDLPVATVEVVPPRDRSLAP